MSPQRFDFEQWYKRIYWDFSTNEVSFNIDTQTYTNLSVNLAWEAWCAGQRALKSFMGVESDAEV
jgi:hypothetical protein